MVSNVFPTLHSSKQKWWSVLTCYYKQHYCFGKVWWKKKKIKCLIKMNFPIIPETENSNKLLLETFSKWTKIHTTDSLRQIRNTHKRAPKIESIKALKTWIIFTATFGNLNKFVLETCSKCYEKNTTCSWYQIRLTQERAQGFG